MIEKRKTDTLGISVNKDLSPVEVYFEGKLDPVAQSELEYLYGGDLKFISGGLSIQNSTSYRLGGGEGEKNLSAMQRWTYKLPTNNLGLAFRLCHFERILGTNRCKTM